MKKPCPHKYINRELTKTSILFHYDKTNSYLQDFYIQYVQIWAHGKKREREF